MANENFMALLRLKAGLTQQQMATKLDASINSVKGWEAGTSVPGVEYAAKAGEIAGVDPVAVQVGVAVDSARKTVAKGEGNRGSILRNAAKFADLSDQADEPAASEALRAGAEELLTIARTIEPETASKSADTNADRDPFGRRLGGIETAVKSEDRASRDIHGKKSGKLLDRQQRTGERNSQRLYEDQGRDPHGRKLGK